MAPKKTHEDFVAEMAIVHPDVEVLGRYENSKTKIKCRHAKEGCGYVFDMTPNNLLHGHSCPNCGGGARTHEWFVSKMAIVHPDIEVLGHYKDAQTKIECRHAKEGCGYAFMAKPNSLLNGHSCPKCGGTMKKTHEQFIAEMAVIHPDIEVLGHYVNARTKIECKHVKEGCGYVFEMRPNNLLNGQSCPKCGGTMRKTQEWFVSEMAKIDDTIEIIGEYESRHKPVKVRCKQCDHAWSPDAGSLLGGHGCPICRNAKGTSFMEELILDAFREVLGKESVLSRNRELIGVELDIVIPSLKAAIEPGGWVWHCDKLDVDKAKRDACKKIGYRLITIYDGYRDERKPFDEDCYTFPFDLGAEPKNKSLRSLIVDLGKRFGIVLDFDEDTWKRLTRTAVRRSRRKTTEEFKAEMAIINPSVEILGEYVNSKKKVSCRCKECGHKFGMRPNNLLMGSGCPPCADKRGAEKRRKTTAQFVEELAKVNPNIKVLGEYKGDNVKVECECLADGCGNIWPGIPSNLLQGHGCPKCKGREASKRQTKSHEEFVERVKKNNPEMEVLGRYTKSRDKIKVRHRKCGYVWEPQAGNIANGTGCPECARKKRWETRRSHGK